jgi:hypothetical protein
VMGIIEWFQLPALTFFARKSSVLCNFAVDTTCRESSTRGSGGFGCVSPKTEVEMTVSTVSIGLKCLIQNRYE